MRANPIPVTVFLLVILPEAEQRTRKKTFKDNDEDKPPGEYGLRRCFDCKSWAGSECGTGYNFSMPTWKGIKCYKGDICRISKATINGTLAIRRDCGTLSRGEEEGCYDGLLEGRNASVCLCDEDFCNAAPGGRRPPGWAWLAWTVGLTLAHLPAYPWT